MTAPLPWNESAPLRAAEPLPLVGAGEVWRIAQGGVDLFLTTLVDGRPQGALHPLFRVAAGELLLPLPPLEREDGNWCVVAVALPGTRLARLAWEPFAAALRRGAGFIPPAPSDAPERPDESGPTTLLNTWLENLTAHLAGPLPRNLAPLEIGEDLPLDTAHTFFARQAGLWVRVLADQIVLLSRSDETWNAADDWLPLPRHAWLGGGVEARLQVSNRLPPDLAAALDAYHLWLLRGLVSRAAAGQEEQRQRLQRKRGEEQARMRQALTRLAALLDSDEDATAEEPSTDALLEACRRVGRAAGMTFVAPPQSSDSGREPLAEILEASRLRMRRVALRGAWWQQDNGSLLGYLGEERRPVALLRDRRGYRLEDPRDGSSRPLDVELAGELQPFAQAFYRSFGDQAIVLGKLLRFAAQGCGPDARVMLAVGAAVGVLGMVVPVATGLLFDSVIPGAEKGQLAQLALALLAGTFATAMLEVTRGTAMLRLEGRMDAAVQAAVWDRLLRLPVPFFRRYSAGDLALRANGISQVRQALTGNLLNILLSAVFSLMSVPLIVYYSPALALLGFALVLLAILALWWSSRVQIGFLRRVSELDGRLSGLVFQLLNNVALLRTCGAESRAFVKWAGLFAQTQALQMKAAGARNRLAVFNAAFPAVTQLALFSLVAFTMQADTSFSTGTFLAFNSAFGTFLGAMLAGSAAFVSVLGVMPIYERARPILEGLPESQENKLHPGQLSGDIEISHLTFRYTPDGPLILKDVSLSIRAGEFIALVGSSGSGKSTLLRLLLGFEQPSSGSVAYDGQDLAGLDLGPLRRQLGVVLQHSQLLTGDIFTNIIGGASLLTLDDAWRAAELAGIAEDIRAMPMGMHTLLSDGGGTLSGGQRQRLLIARAIVNRPRILFFDETTSALDNRAQEQVSRSLDNLRATRVVIAHRLSTIVHADRIFVLDNGQLVQSGTYRELLAVPGPFAELAKRQLQ